MGLDIDPNFESEPTFGKKYLIEFQDTSGVYPTADHGSPGQSSYDVMINAVNPDGARDQIPWGETYDTRIPELVAEESLAPETDPGPSAT